MELDKNFGHSEKLHPSTFDSATFYSRPITEQKNETEKAQLPPLQPEAQITVFIYVARIIWFKEQDYLVQGATKKGTVFETFWGSVGEHFGTQALSEQA